MSDVLRSGPFTSVNGDRAYLVDFFRDYFKQFISNGVFADPSNGLQVMADTGLAVTVKKGAGYINGASHLPKGDESLTLEVGDSLPRIDKVVLRMDTINRTITKEIKKGTAATNAKAPSLQRDADAWELGLANISVDAGANSISQSNIRDLRMDNEQCGIVKGVVDQIDTTDLFAQYQTAFNEDRNQFQTDFNVWFEDIKGQLAGDVAGNLLNKINDIPKIHSGVTEPVDITTGDYWFKEV